MSFVGCLIVGLRGYYYCRVRCFFYVEVSLINVLESLGAFCVFFLVVGVLLVVGTVWDILMYVNYVYILSLIIIIKFIEDKI